MSQFPPIFSFLHDLRLNNNHEWFAAHRPEYDQAKTFFEDFIQGPIFRFDAALPPGQWPPGMPSFAIESDMRFAKNLAALQRPLLSSARFPAAGTSLRLPCYKHNHAPGLFSGERRAHAHV
jgi:uncharacterized protein (DUF2461 family)